MSSRGNPHHIGLPSWFSLGGSEVREYEQGLVGNAKRPILRLLADIPEFHPPNPRGLPNEYVYVGPLIDTQTRHRWFSRAAALFRGKRPRTVVVSIGSTGQDPGFLKPVLSSLEARGLESLLIGTSRSVDDPNRPVSVADFIPAVEILNGADLLICTGGSGIMYHALRAGVPIVGAPEHLDQEYHLNRVHEMRLGVKLNWQQLHCFEEFDRALTLVIDSFPEYRERCRRLGNHVKRWEGGELGAQAVETFIESIDRGYDFSWERLVDGEEFLHELDLSSPSSLGSVQLRSLLEEGIQQGMPHWHRTTQVYL